LATEGVKGDMQEKAKRAAKSNLVKGATGDWEVVIGMEVHAQVNSKAKLFSGASTAFGGAPNAQVSLVDAAMPGMLPVINAECVAQAVRTGLGLKAKINLNSVFDRKNYFYPDLPQGYQISQYKQPIVGEGVVEVDAEGETFKVGIERLHLEQDAGKSIHDRHPEYSYVDLNRSGVALMEIVSKPDVRSARQAQAFLSKVRTILRYLGTSDGDMEKGNLRADVNVSVRRAGEKKLGTRCEIKNLNSFRFIGQAIEAEARRQIDILEDGGAIEQETRLFDSVKGETRSMRSKEEAHDYRYFPDPDLLPLELTQEYVDGLKKGLPELPDEKRARFMKEDALREDDAVVLVSERARADLYERIRDGLLSHMPRARASREACKQVLGPIAKLTNDDVLDLTKEDDFEWAAVNSDLVLVSLSKQEIHQNAANTAILESAPTRRDSMDYIREHDLLQVTDTGAIEAAVESVIAANPDKVAQAKAKPAALGWFVGQVMKATGGKANPQAVNELLRKKLGV
jgi:aspartyl-tRNA(Asn)/glutamyl-tRNA(Gln) amidotransferase subunit B